MSTFDINKRMVIKDRFGEVIDYKRLKLKLFFGDLKKYIYHNNLGPVEVIFEPIKKVSNV